MTSPTPPETAAAIPGLPDDLTPSAVAPALMDAMHAHLAACGLESFDDADGPARFYGWIRELLGPDRCAFLEELRQKRGPESLSRYPDDVAYYEVYGDPQTARALQSMRTGYFRETGPRVLAHLPDSGTLVDAGCCTGILTSWYAAQRPNLNVLGIDRVPATLKTARKLALELGISNVRYDTADVLRLIPARELDAVVSTTAFWRTIRLEPQHQAQFKALETTADRARFLQGSQAMRFNATVIYTIRQALRDGGRLVIMERMFDEVNAEALRILHALAGFTEVAFDTVAANDEGRRQVFGLLVLEKGELPQRPAIPDETAESTESAE